MNFPWRAKITRNVGTKKLFPFVQDRERFFQWIEETFKDGDVVHITVKKPSKSRTHEQFKYLYACVYTPMAEDMGVDMDTMDGIMKRRHLTVNPDSPLEYVKNKTDLDRAELAKYIDVCRSDAADMGIETMDPI